MFPPNGYCLDASLNKRGISSQLALEFSIRQMVISPSFRTRYFELSSHRGSLNSFARMVFSLCGSPRSSTKKLVWLNAGRLTKRGFLTLRDSLVVIYASITLASFCFTSERARESSRFYTFNKVPKVVGCSLRLLHTAQSLCSRRRLCGT